MLVENFVSERNLKKESYRADLVVAGGGITGVCAAIAAAREGIKVALVQDRPVLGGNGSSEVRVWMLGATSHMGNNNRWAREGGIIDEILVENTYRNKEGNPVIFDTVLLDKVLAEKNIKLFLNTAIYDVKKSDGHTIESVSAFNTQTQTHFEISGSYFCDASGDGIVGARAGAAFRIGAENADEYDEKFAPDKHLYGEKLGHSILFYVKDTAHPVKYIAPHFAMPKEEVEKYINRIQNPNYFTPKQLGCKYWWIEYGGRLDTIADTEEIKYKLWSVLYGIWDYIKNSGKYPEAETMTLEWVGLYPGKRESRRFTGYYALNQKDIIEQHPCDDAVAFGGWSIDLHPSDGVFSDKSACNQWHSKGVYPIPYRCYITPDIHNLFIGGRLMSATHVAHGSSRVMATAALGGEAIGTAAALCLREGCRPAEIAEPERMKQLQTRLVYNGAYLPQCRIEDAGNLVASARIEATSEMRMAGIPFDGGWKSLSQSAAQMLPLRKGGVPRLTVALQAEEDTELTVELRVSSKPFNHTPDTVLESVRIAVAKGEAEYDIAFAAEIPADCYAFICFMSNDRLAIRTSACRVTGLLSVFNKILPAVSNFGKQTPPDNIGVEAFEFWCPERRPDGENIAMRFSSPIDCFSVENLRTSLYRPVEQPNAWVADWNDEMPEVSLSWDSGQSVKTIRLYTDTDADHPMESVQWGHFDSRMPFCVKEITICDGQDRILAEIKDNYQTLVTVDLPEAVTLRTLKIRLSKPAPNIPAALFAINIQS